MKKIIARAFALVMAMFLLTNSVFAADNILIYGNVSGMAKDITIVALDKNADINNVKIQISSILIRHLLQRTDFSSFLCL